MRLLVLVLAIVLLPLRGWMGDAMALQLPPSSRSAPILPGAPAAHNHAPHAQAGHAADPGQAHGHEQGHEHAHQATDPASPQAALSTSATCADAGDSDCGTGSPHAHHHCVQCQLCHSALLPALSLRAPSVAPTDPHPRTGAQRFASAAPHPLDKPPIS